MTNPFGSMWDHWQLILRVRLHGSYTKDLIYLSKLFIDENSSFEESMKQQHIEPLEEKDLEEQFRYIKTELESYYNGKSGPLITKYELLDFIY